MNTEFNNLTEVEVAFENTKEVRWLSENEIQRLSQMLIDIATTEVHNREDRLISKLNYPAR